MMQYKDYFGSIHYSDDDKIFYGQVEYIRSLISFEGEDVVSLRASFQEAIDDYLALCEEKSIEPEKPFRGSFEITYQYTQIVGQIAQKKIGIDLINEEINWCLPTTIGVFVASYSFLLF